ncbi:MAG TPA: PAS domain S-box protein [Pseudorhodoferax sp.]|nr:PAS domain S-box protein [Pseudorhodoferax sp.]
MFNGLFSHMDAAPSMQVVGSYDPWLVALSLVVAIGSSWAALQLVGYARATAGGLHRIASGAGAIVLGAGIWAMHFIGMLAFQLCARVDYSPSVTVASMAPSLVASATALRLIAQPRISSAQLVVGGVLVGTGIGAMHYGGMLAMRTTLTIVFDPPWVGASIGIAVVLAVLALWVRFGLLARGHLSVRRANIIAALVMGMAIAGMHYTAMAAARFAGVAAPDSMPLQNEHLSLAAGVAAVALGICLLAFGVHALLRFVHINQQLRESEGRLRAVVDTAVDGIVSVGATGVIQSFNHSAERIFGWHADEVIGKSVRMLMTPESAGADDSHIADYLRLDADRILGAGREVRGVNRSGARIALRLAVSRIVVRGQPVFFGIVTDISVRKAIQHELRLREAQYRTLIANMPGVAFRREAGASGRLLFVSDRIENLTGWPAVDFMAGHQSLAALVPPDDASRAQSIVGAALLAGQPYSVEYRLVHRDGHERWISESAGGARDAGGILQSIDGVMIDVTDERLRRRQFETAVHVLNSAMAVMEIDPAGRIVSCNDKYVAMMGYAQASELLGKPYEDMLPAQRSKTAEHHAIAQALRQGHVLAGEFERVGRDGRAVWVQATYNPVYDEAGKFVRMMAFKTDVTQRKRMEAELREAKLRAEQAAAARTSFLANMSHEIRTPMNAILGFTEALLNTQLAAAQRRHLETVRQAGQSLLGLLNDILDTSKLDKGAVELESIDFSLRSVCEQVINSMRLAADNKLLWLELDYPDGLPEYFCGDALRLQQVLVNLVGNAIKFTREGGVSVAVRRASESTVIAVTDTGIGIAPDRLERIFDAFAQADATITRRYGGTGLGTTIARQLTELMGGHIVVASTLGKGSCFEVHLPLPVGHRPVAPAGDVAPSLPALEILVADDVEQNIELLELMLQADGHRVQAARNGLDAVDRCRQRRFDLVLMDVHMPDMDGLAATRALRAFEDSTGQAPTPVIALTASVLVSDRQAALRAGMNGFATKPIITSQLYGEIARVLGIQPPSPTPLSERTTPAIVDWERGLELWGSPERLVQAISRFVANEKDSPTTMRMLAAQQDLSAVAALTHRICGIAGNLALTELHAKALDLDSAARAGDEIGVTNGIATLSRALGQVTAAFPAQVATVVPPRVHEIDRTALQSVFARLERTLGAHTIDEEALQALNDAVPSAALRALLAALDHFDFPRALQCLSALRASLFRTNTPSP